jgi:hypothetical protein
MGALQTYNPGQFLELISQDPKASADFRYLPETDKLESNTIEVTEICTKRLFVGNVTKYGQTDLRSLGEAMASYTKSPTTFTIRYALISMTVSDSSS